MEIIAPIPENIIEIGKKIHRINTCEELLEFRHTIVNETAGNADTFSYLQKVYIRQKRKLGMKCNAGKKMTI